MRQNYRNYSRNNQRYSVRNNKSHTWKIILGIIALVLIICVAFVVFSNTCTNNSSEEGPAPQAPQAPQTQADSIVITLHGCEDTKVLKGEEYIESGAHAIDKNDGNISNTIKIEGNVDTSTPGKYQVKYSATNKKGEGFSRTRNVEVVESMDKAPANLGVPVLMYHWVYQDGNPPANLDSNFISTSNLTSQLEYLSKNNFYYPSYQELRAFIDGKHSLPKKSVILTFDDGEIGFLNYGKPLFEKYKVPVTSFIICNLDASPQNIITYASEYIDFQSHTYALHVDGSSGKGHGGKIFDLDKNQTVQDFKKAAEVLGTNEALAYPFGDVGDYGPDAVKEAGILCAFTVNPGFVKPGADFTQLPRVRILGNQSLESFIATVE